MNFRGVRRGLLLDSTVAGDLAISDVARVFGLRSSAIRYYEQIGILPPPMRKNGQRRYDKSALFRLAVVQRARETGFTLEEIRELFLDSRRGRVHQNAGTSFLSEKSRNSRTNEAASGDGDIAQGRQGLLLRRTRGVRRENSSTKIKVKNALVFLKSAGKASPRYLSVVRDAASSFVSCSEVQPTKHAN